MSVRSGSHSQFVEASGVEGALHPRGALLPGTIVSGRFRIERLVASGAMGNVWEGAHCELQLRVAVKTLRKEVMSNREIVARFSREAFLLGRIQSEHVARVLDFTLDRRFGPLLVTEFIEGPSLASFLQGRRLTVEEAIDLGIDVVRGLGALHRAQIIHRDVKPANILLRTLGECGRCAVFVDFGVSRLATRDEGSDDALTEITMADRAVGTFEYMAPEQILSSRTVTVSADLYAVGAILYRAVAGHHAFGDASGPDLARHKLSLEAPALVTGRSDRVAKRFEALVARALAQSPGDRYELADALLADLVLLRDARPLEPAPPSPEPARPESHVRKPRRTARLAVLLGLLVGALVSVGGVAGARWARLGKPAIASQPAQLEFEHCSIEPADPPSQSAVTIVCRKPR
jgi:serine/threonine-protein kinase